MKQLVKLKSIGIVSIEAGNTFLGSYRYTKKETKRKKQKGKRKSIGIVSIGAGNTFLGSYRYTKKDTKRIK